MRKVIAIAFFLVLIISGACLGFQNEPDGFRDLKWGDPPSEDMVLVEKTDEFDSSYSRPDDKLSIGKAQLIKIEYGFYKLPQDDSPVFTGVMLAFEGEHNHYLLENISRERFGQPTMRDSSTSVWLGAKTVMILSYYSIEKKGSLLFFDLSLSVRRFEAKAGEETKYDEEDW